ncbi:WDR90 protein, partial [Pterocles burchelli]|nr:WDR90 protein [Pterocles burchelli]
VPAAWQRPYLNVFKHFRVEEWKRSAREGDVATLTVPGGHGWGGGGGCGRAALTPLSLRQDPRLKGTVYRIRGAGPTSSYLQLPRTGTQSLGLLGGHLYLLFKPLPRKHFVVHLDVTTEEGQVVRVSFSSLFREFRSTATWLQFPFVCGGTAGVSGRGRLGAAPAEARWTCLALDLRAILSLYLSRRYSHLKSVRLCANLLVKNIFTSDLLFDPGVTFAEARHADPTGRGAAPMPREMAFPVPKGQRWHDLYDYIRYGHTRRGSGTCRGSGTSCSSGEAGWVLEDPIQQMSQPVTLTKAVRDRLSLVQQITSPKAVSAPWRG